MSPLVSEREVHGCRTGSGTKSAMPLLSKSCVRSRNGNNNKNTHLTALCPGLQRAVKWVLLLLSRTTRVSRYHKKHSPTHNDHGHQSSLILLTPSITIYGILPVQFTCLTVFLHNLSKFSLIYILAWHPPLHTPYISSPNHCLLFAAHAHIITIYFAVVLKLCHLLLVSQPLLHVLLAAQEYM